MAHGADPVMGSPLPSRGAVPPVPGAGAHAEGRFRDAHLDTPEPGLAVGGLRVVSECVLLPQLGTDFRYGLIDRIHPTLVCVLEQIAAPARPVNRYVWCAMVDLSCKLWNVGTLT